MGARCPRSRQRKEANGARAADERRPAETEASGLYAVEDYAQGLQEGRLRVADIFRDPTAMVLWPMLVFLVIISRS